MLLEFLSALFFVIIGIFYWRYTNTTNTTEESPPREKKQKKPKTTMQAVKINVKGGEKFEFEFASPVMGSIVLERISKELNCDVSAIKVLQSGKVVKDDTVITKALKVMMKKKTKSSVSKTVNVVKSYTWNFDFQSFWKSFYDLGNALLSTKAETPVPNSPQHFPSENSNAQCKATLLQTSQTLQSLAQLLANEADSISNNPEKHKETLDQLSRAGSCLQKLSDGLISNSIANSDVKPKSVPPVINQKTVEDELFDDLLEENPIAELEVNQSQVAKTSKPATSPNLMDMMSSLLKKPAAASSQIKVDPTAWKKDVPKGEMKDWQRMMARDLKSMKEWNVNFSDAYLSGSSSEKRASGMSAMFGM